MLFGNYMFSYVILCLGKLCYKRNAVNEAIVVKFLCP